MVQKAEQFLVEDLAKKFPTTHLESPLKESFGVENFVQDDERILAEIEIKSLQKLIKSNDEKAWKTIPSFELAGAREKTYWDPKTATVAIVTCGGLAPGLNNVLQSIVNVLWDRYGVRNIYGVPFGFFGFNHDPQTQKFRFGWRRLDTFGVQHIDSEAGSVLGSARGHSNIEHIVDGLVSRRVDILFTIGGDGTLTAAQLIHEEITRRKLRISVIGIPKTVDNDIMWVSKSFGFETAVEKAVEALKCAQTEARGVFNGIGLVRLMGRHSGSLTAAAAAAQSGVDFVLVPEIKLVLEGENGFLNTLVKRVTEKGHAVIAVAEGAGQHLFPESAKTFDASGNVKLNNIGIFLQEKILQEFKKYSIECTLKYIDPTYILRAQTTTANDSLFCANLGQSAVHAAMAGKTGAMIGHAHNEFTHIPLKALTLGKKCLDIKSPLWLSVLSSTGQPPDWI